MARYTNQAYQFRLQSPLPPCPPQQHHLYTFAPTQQPKTCCPIHVKLGRMLTSAVPPDRVTRPNSAAASNTPWLTLPTTGMSADSVSDLRTLLQRAVLPQPALSRTAFNLACLNNTTTTHATHLCSETDSRPVRLYSWPVLPECDLAQ